VLENKGKNLGNSAWHATSPLNPNYEIGRKRRFYPARNESVSKTIDAPIDGT